MNNKKQNRGLGRGLSALMSDIETTNAPAPTGQKQVPIELLTPNPDQPRKTFSQPELDDLAESIRQKGVIQPLIVRQDPNRSEGFQIVAGERRWRAAQIANVHALPVIVKDFNDQDVLEIGIIENIQREDLNPLEEALSYKQLMDRFGHTQEQVSKALGKSRSHIANLVRLLTLPDDIQALVRENKLSAGHARALITAQDPGHLAKTVIAKGLSVRETERLAASTAAPEKPKAVSKSKEKDADTKALEAELSAAIKMPVSIDHDGKTEGGALRISYRSLEQLDDLCRVLSGG